jgi:HKD family nuclease
MLHIQNPQLESSFSLHEAMMRACTGAKSGGGAFAFVTSGGVRLCLEDKEFQKFLKKGDFELVVGVDEVTDLNAVNQLSRLSKEFGHLKVSAFAHDFTDCIFHPKFCWFETATGGTLIVGSGNLTVRGLRRNWEAFSMVSLDADAFRAVIAEWQLWKQSCADNFRPLEDEDVLTRVKENIRVKTTRPKKTGKEKGKTEADEHPEDSSPWEMSEENRVLIAEIPRASDRWNQANFSKQSFESFFGGTTWDNSYRILLRAIMPDGSLDEVENRQAVSVKSHNWRFELGEASGKAYPPDRLRKRPIGIFVKVGVRMFLYVLVMPDTPHANEVYRFLKKLRPFNESRMRREETTLNALREHCPNLPFWKVQG